MIRLKNLKYIISFLVLVVLAATAYFVFKQPPPTKPFISAPVNDDSNIEDEKETHVIVSPDLQQLLGEYEDAIIKLMNDEHTPGVAIAIVKDSSIIYLKGLGVKSINKPDRVNVHTVFRIASVSKCFASMLTGILVEDSILSWDDKVVKYLPDFCLKSSQQTANLSIRHVLSHTTSLPYHTFTNQVEEGTDISTLLKNLSEVNTTGNVGETYSYQNVAYSLVGEVMKSATGKPYEELMIEKVFKPLKMKDASISYDAIIKNENIAKPHRPQRRKGLALAPITNTYYNVAPAGGINASISDMAKWMIALLGDRNDVISDQILDQIYTPQVKARSKNRNYNRLHRIKNSYYALGWRVLHFSDDTLIYHGGYVNGYRSEVAINRRDKIGICILANAPGEVADNGIPLFFALYENKQGSIPTKK